MQLLIDTSTRYASVALAREGELVIETTWRSERNHSVELVPAIRDTMARAGVTPANLEAVFTAKGPGGFSALRVGMSTAKTLAASLGVPLVAVGTLDMEAHPYATVSPAVAAVIGAGRNRLYIGRYGAASTHASPEYDVIASDMLAAMIAPGTLLCGEAALESVGLLTGALASQVKIVHRPPPTRSMSVMAELGHSKLLSGHVEDPASLQPTYLRSSQVNMANQAWAVKQP